jgi:hypothetical protein
MSASGILTNEDFNQRKKVLHPVSPGGGPETHEPLFSPVLHAVLRLHLGLRKFPEREGIFP